MNSIMGEYALLTEVYGNDYQKKSKKKKEKKEKSRNQIVEPNEMDRVLLNEQSLSPEVKLRNLEIDPYENDIYHHSFNHDNPNIKQANDYSPQSIHERQTNQTNQPINRQNNRSSSYKDDPEYQEFLEYKEYTEYKEYKRTKSLEHEMKIIDSKRETFNSYSGNDQMNELLLYIFTGFFILLLFDNIYKMGKRSY
jgi:hypothetical protein